MKATCGLPSKPIKRYRLLPNKIGGSGYSIIELIVVSSILVITMGLGSEMFRWFGRFLEQRRLRETSMELASYLQMARARALKQSLNQSSAQSQFCAIGRSDLVFQPLNISGNACNDNNPSPLPSLNLVDVAGVRGLAISGSTDDLTFNSRGLLSAWNPGVSITTAPLAMPRMIYLSSSSAGVVQYCIYIDLVSIRIGFRNGASGPCIFNRG